MLYLLVGCRQYTPIYEVTLGSVRPAVSSRMFGKFWMSRQKKVSLGTVYFEFLRMGNVVKVSAIDPKTGTEVCIVGNPKAGQETLKRVAARKLEYVMKKRLG